MKPLTILKFYLLHKDHSYDYFYLNNNHKPLPVSKALGIEVGNEEPVHFDA